jgi:hypothetical protein
LHALVPKELLQGDKIRLLNLVLEYFQPNRRSRYDKYPVSYGWRERRKKKVIQEGARAYQLLPMVSHSKFKSLFWSPVSEVVYSDKEKGMALRACWPEEPPPVGNCAPVAEAADGLSRELDAAAAATFGLLEGVSEPLLEVEPNMSTRVL